METLKIIVSILIVLGIIIIPIVLKRKKVSLYNEIISVLPTVITSSDIFFKLMEDLDIIHDEKIKDIFKIIKEALDFVEESFDNHVTEDSAIKYAESLVLSYNIDLTYKRRLLIKNLISIGYKEIKDRT